MFSEMGTAINQIAYRKKHMGGIVVPLLISCGIAGVILGRGRTGSRATTYLQICLHILLIAMLFKWASLKKGRLIAMGFGAIFVLGVAVVMLGLSIFKRSRRNS